MKSRNLLFSLLVLLAATASWSPLQAAGRGEPGMVVPVRVELGDEAADLQLFRDLDLDIDAVFYGWARLYLLEEEIAKLEQFGFALTPLPDEGKIGLARMSEEGIARDVGKEVPALYHTYDTLTSDLNTIATDHSTIARLESIGQSVQGRELWMMKITDNPDSEEDEPEIHYISSMHGDEVVGKELCFNLINYLTDNYGTDPRVTNLVDSAEIRIMPSMNPDGTELGRRYNANGVDLNRHFPDQFVDPVNTTAGREPEAVAVMQWVLDRRPILSLNYHGGALVANYPFDGNPAATNTFSPVPNPDHDALVMLARTYADNNPTLFASNSHSSFDNGICNGADWYYITGGMQDWFFVWSGGRDITLEVGNVKWPPASELPAFWDDNLESMLSYFERSLEGLRGIVTDGETGAPLSAEIRVDGSPWPSYTDPDVGDYHRVLTPGTYSVEVSAGGYDPLTIPGVVVTSGAATILDIELGTLSTRLHFADSRVDDGPIGNDHLDAGETADIAVSLRNMGGPASTVTATLVPTGWLTEIGRPQASFPAFSTGETAESLAPHFGITVSPSTPDGYKAGFAVEWQSESGSGLTGPFFLEVGEPSNELVAATDLPQTVSRIFSAYSTVQAAARKISEVRVPINIQHTFVGELTVTLTSPQGTEVTLHAPGGGGANIVGTYGVDLIPAESLSAFIGQEAEGTWILEITDNALVNNGSLQAWSLDVYGYPGDLPSPEMRFRGASKQSGGAQFEWWPYPGLTSYRVYRSTDPSSSAAFLDVTGEDGDDSDTLFLDGSTVPLVYYLVTGVGSQGEGPKGHFGE
jgi:subtilisin-like proprotein convertase family protein